MLTWRRHHLRKTIKCIIVARSSRAWNVSITKKSRTSSNNLTWSWEPWPSLNASGCAKFATSAHSLGPTEVSAMNNAQFTNWIWSRKHDARSRFGLRWAHVLYRSLYTFLVSLPRPPRPPRPLTLQIRGLLFHIGAHRPGLLTLDLLVLKGVSKQDIVWEKFSGSWVNKRIQVMKP